jgi:MFS family permease
MSEPKKLLSFEFVLLNAVSFFGFCNIAVFYSFFTYLQRIDIAPEWRGFLLGLEPMAAFALRPVAIAFLHAGNALRTLVLSLVMIAVALCSYAFTTSLAGLVVLRLFHGAAFVFLVSSIMTLIVHFIPREKSGQGFGILSVAMLLPYAVMPSMTEALLPRVHDEAHIYAWISVLAVPGVVLLLSAGRRMRAALGRLDSAVKRRPTLGEFLVNVRQVDVLLLLAVNLLIYFCHATVFFFMKSLAVQMDVGNVGIFFPIYTLAMIAVRVCVGTYFDKVNQLRSAEIFMVLLAGFFLVFSHTTSAGSFYALAGYYGFCLGIVLPLLNATLFKVSFPQFRGVNTNLALFSMDAGYFLGPFAGGALLAGGHSPTALLSICAGFVSLALVLIVVLEQVSKRDAKKAGLADVTRRGVAGEE